VGTVADEVVRTAVFVDAVRAQLSKAFRMDVWRRRYRLMRA
jgi:hypothetical protein